MRFTERLGGFLGLPSKGDLEMLQERVAVQERLLESSVSTPKTFASSQAKETQTLVDVMGSVARRVSIRQLQHLYLFNQFIFRGVNVRADETITRGYVIDGKDKEGVRLCEELINNSGGINLFWQLSVNCDVNGNGFLEKVPNVSGDKLVYLKHLNPVNFGFRTDLETSQIVVDSNGFPIGYQQILSGADNKPQTIFVDFNRIAHLRFNTFADEFNGVSSIQPVYNTAARLMNMENAAAEAAVKSANPIFIGKTKTKSPHELAKWSKILSRISAKEQVFLPDGVEIETISPGTQNFSAYSDYFLSAVVAALGVPRAILTGSADSSGGNRSTVTIQSRHFYSVIRANQRYIERLFNENIFKDYAERAGFDAPVLKFNDIAEDADVNGQRAIELYDSNVITITEARQMIGLETDEKIIKDLTESQTIKNNNVSNNLNKNNDDAKTYFPSEPGSPRDGSQKGQKRKQKRDPDVKSVK